MVEPIQVSGSRRVDAIDVARGVALLAMAVYHFTWDLEFVGYLEAGTTLVGGWKFFARSIATSFLFLVGVSLWLAHHNGVRWRSFGIRLLMVAGAAGAISLVTWLAVPGGFIFFGILHQIALASVVGLLFLRLPGWLVALSALAVIAAPAYLRSTAFDTPWLWWVGLSSENPRSNDYVPLFPWFGVVLLGLAAAKVASTLGWFERLRGWHANGPWRLADRLGQHSLAFYLIHQPVLLSLVFLAAQIMPPAVPDPTVGFRNACQTQCMEVRDEAFCTGYCGCVLELVETDGGVARLDEAASDPINQTRMQEIALYCTNEADLDIFGGSDGEP